MSGRTQPGERDAIGSLQFSTVSPSDLPTLARALQEAGLPSDDVPLPGRVFYAFQLAGQLVGYAALEVYGADALLRSVLIVPPHRGSGLGRLVVDAMETLAADSGIATLHLLTTNQVVFFERLGYMLAPRHLAPTEIASTTQFKSLCPSSASYLRKKLAGDSPTGDEPTWQ